jgi:hypothetical protein
LSLDSVRLTIVVHVNRKNHKLFQFVLFLKNLSMVKYCMYSTDTSSNEHAQYYLGWFLNDALPGAEEYVDGSPLLRPIVRSANRQV